MKKINCYHCWRPAVLIILALQAFAVVCSAQENPKSILILHSYHKAAWTDSLLEGIESVLGRTSEVDLVVEYMDTKRIKSEAYYQSLDALYGLKYKNVRFDVLLTCDDNAYRFALNRQASMFKGAPIVFCGVNRFDPGEIENNPLVTGVVEKGDFEQTLDLAVRGRPKAAAVHLIIDHTPTARINRQGFTAVIEREHPALAVHDLIDLSVADLGAALADLPVDDFAFFISYWQDGAGRPVTPENLSAAFSQSAVPIFGRSEWMMGKGLTGGKCVSGYAQGRTAAQLAARILNGDNPADLPVNLNSPNRFMADYRLLLRYGIDPGLLPAGTIFFNRPEPSYYHTHRMLVWAVIAVVVILLCLVVFLVVNIVHRRRAGSALLESEKRYRAVIENAADAIYLCDPQGKIVDVNREACIISGYTRQELLQRNVMDVDGQYTGRSFVARVWEKLTLEGVQTVESLTRRKDGSVFPVQVRIARIDIDNKAYALGLVRDITERKRMEAELRESEERYRRLVQYAPTGIYDVDMTHDRFLSVNDVMAEYSGYSVEELLQLNPMELVAEESRPVVQRILESATPGNATPAPLEYRIKGKDGRRLWVMGIFRFVFEGSTPVKLNAIVHDRTAQRKAEEEKMRLEAKLAQIQKIESLGTLAGGIAHDFNNLLMGIQGNASLMLLEKERTPDDLTQLHSIEQYVNRGVQLTSQLLGLSREGKYEVKPTDLNRLVVESLEIFSRTNKQLRIHRSMEDNIWSVECDQGQIDQVLLNLFVNAAHAMPDGGDLYITTENTIPEAVQVQPHELTEGRYVKISVKDTGIGMNPAIMEKIFDPFFTTRERERGTGLGLASAYGIINNHGGFIEVSSRVGHGSIFNVFLPASSKPFHVEDVTDEQVLTGKEHILLVDDETMVLKVGQRILEKLGYQVFTARTGAEALSLFDKNKGKIDLVVLDMIMPDMSGEETFSRLQKQKPDVRVLLSSGYSADGQAAKIIAQGCRGFIQKPFRVHEISQKIRKVIEG